ncbi:GNAT family N-acetyltransferase [Yinghuangia soli]|uniref:GNAT family N-acetyltransferase n=1 Tax=Yinghuangia soli TaxID=2908204 RepID=A0AA41TZK4_9ACTN|nr:GNAT family N-acetyltransferase [Yinghuangia soli]MCF2528913.1 GNAT family N-acetyltransferase [Yinghuangia soli]
MGKRVTRKVQVSAPLTAERLRAGWQGPAGTRLLLARPQDAGAADALMGTAGDQVAFDPSLRTAIEDGSAASSMLAGLASEAAYREAAARSFTSLPTDEALASVCLTLVATDARDQVVGVLSGTAPGTVMAMAARHGHNPQRCLALSLFIAKVHGLAVAEHARGQGIASALLERAGQVYEQLGYRLLYGAYEADRDLGAFYARSGYTTLVPGAGFSLGRLGLPFMLRAGADECVFLRWRPRP